MKFSKNFGLTTPQNGFEFFDLDLTSDTKLFVDSYYISKLTTNPYVAKMDKTLKVFVYDLLQHVKNNRQKDAYQLCSHFSETKGTGIGYSKNKINGHGAGDILSTTLVDAIFTSKAIVSQKVVRLEEFTVACEGINKDIISDIVLSVAKLGFIEFTQDQCRKHGIPMQQTTEKLSYFCPVLKQWQSDYFDLPHITDPNTSKPQEIILIPKKILSDQVIYDHRYFLRSVVIPFFKKELINQNHFCVRTRKNGDKYVINDDFFALDIYHAKTKKDAINFINEHPQCLEDFRRIEAPYRFDKLKVS